MSIESYSNQYEFSQVYLLKKDHKICQGCQIRSIDIDNKAVFTKKGFNKIQYKKSSQKRFVENYQLREDEASVGLVEHIYNLSYKRSFVAYHKPNSENCYRFKVVRINLILQDTPEEGSNSDNNSSEIKGNIR